MNFLRLAQLVVPLLLATSATAKVLDLPIEIQNSYRVVNVQLGTPAKTYKLLYDTGSAGSWVNDANCAQTCPNTNGLPRTPYNVSESSTGVALGPVSTIQYTGSNVIGSAVLDEMTLLDASFNQTFLAVSQSSQTFSADGILGLASSSIAPTNVTTVMDELLAQGIADSPRFGVYQGSAVRSWTETSPANDGVLTLGGSREEKYGKGEVKWVDALVPFEVYKLPLISVVMTNDAKDETVPSTFSWNSEVVFDTGSASITGPEAFIRQIYDMTPWSYDSLFQGVRPLCSEFNSSWSFTLNLGVEGGLHQSLKVTGDQLRAPGYQDDDHCFPPFDGWEYDNIIVGSHWLSNWYTVFDLGAQKPQDYKVRLGFAELKDEHKPKYPTAA